MTSYNFFKANLIELLTAVTDNLVVFLGPENTIMQHMRHHIIPRLSANFSMADYYYILKVSAAFRYLRLTNPNNDLNFESFFSQNAIPDFMNITSFVESHRRGIDNDELISNVYYDLEDWLMICLDSEIDNIISKNHTTIISPVIAPEYTKSLWFLIVYLPLFRGSDEMEWMHFLGTILNYGINENLHLVFYPKDHDFISPSDAITLIPNLLSKLYADLNKYHLQFENQHF
jgi:hypothetical protein